MRYRSLFANPLSTPLTVTNGSPCPESGTGDPIRKKKSEQYAIAPNNSGISRIQVLSLSSNLSTMENYC